MIACVTLYTLHVTYLKQKPLILLERYELQLFVFQFNFVGKLLGPRGSSLKQLQSSSMTKMAILGKGSMRNPAQEEELRTSTDPKHTHLGEDLHVEITTFASPAEAHARLALALSEIRAYLIPDSNDQIRQQQMRDIKMIKMSGPGPGQTSDTPAEVR